MITPKTPELIAAIKADLAKRISMRAIAKKFNVTTRYVRKIKCNIIVEPKVVGADPTNERILKLEAKVLTVTDERNRLKKAYEAALRKNSIFEAVVDELEKVVTPIKALPKLPKLKTDDSKIKESCVLFLSDEHADTIVEPHQVGGLEHYNFPIALRRAEQLVDTTIKFTQSTMVNYEFNDLWVFAIGDHVSGSIHGATEHSEYRNDFKNSLAVGQMHSLMFRDLAAVFPQIHVIYLSGNHGRRTQKKDYRNPHNNFDYLVAKIAELHCANINNIDFLIPDSFVANVEIEGHGFSLAHGDDIRSYGGISWYGINRKVQRLTALDASINRKTKYFGFGHFHQPSTLANLDGEIIINGSFVATDPYAFNAITAWGSPSQWLMGVHRENGISWRLNVKLRTEREVLGPARYSVLL